MAPGKLWATINKPWNLGGLGIMTLKYHLKPLLLKLSSATEKDKHDSRTEEENP